MHRRCGVTAVGLEIVCHHLGVVLEAPAAHDDALVRPDVHFLVPVKIGHALDSARNGILDKPNSRRLGLPSDDIRQLVCLGAEELDDVSQSVGIIRIEANPMHRSVGIQLSVFCIIFVDALAEPIGVFVGYIEVIWRPQGAEPIRMLHRLAHIGLANRVRNRLVLAAKGLDVLQAIIVVVGRHYHAARESAIAAAERTVALFQEKACGAVALSAHRDCGGQAGKTASDDDHIIFLVKVYAG